MAAINLWVREDRNPSGVYTYSEFSEYTSLRQRGWKNYPHCRKEIWKLQIIRRNFNGFSFVTITNYETFFGQRKIVEGISIYLAFESRHHASMNGILYIFFFVMLQTLQWITTMAIQWWKKDQPWVTIYVTIFTIFFQVRTMFFLLHVFYSCTLKEKGCLFSY